MTDPEFLAHYFKLSNYHAKEMYSWYSFGRAANRQVDLELIMRHFLAKGYADA